MNVDRIRRFSLERHPVRGHWVALEFAWRELRAHQELPNAIRDLLGEAVAAATLLASTLKFDGTLTLQLQGDGIVSLLVAQCTHDFRIRAVARCAQAEIAGDFRALVGDGHVAVTVESGERGARYQGIVPLEGESFSECFERYFATSEQLPTRVRLAADGTRAAGLLLQRVPATGGSAAAGGSLLAASTPSSDEEAEALWRQVGAALDGVMSQQLLTTDAETLLRASLGEHDVRLFEGHPVRFECRCDPARVSGLLRTLGEAEVRCILAERGEVMVTCEYCRRPYRFDAIDVSHLFASGSSPDGSSRVN